MKEISRTPSVKNRSLLNMCSMCQVDLKIGYSVLNAESIDSRKIKSLLIAIIGELMVDQCLSQDQFEFIASSVFKENKTKLSGVKMMDKKLWMTVKSSFLICEYVGSKLPDNKSYTITLPDNVNGLAVYSVDGSINYRDVSLLDITDKIKGGCVVVLKESKGFSNFIKDLKELRDHNTWRFSLIENKFLKPRKIQENPPPKYQLQWKWKKLNNKSSTVMVDPMHSYYVPSAPSHDT